MMTGSRPLGRLRVWTAGALRPDEAAAIRDWCQGCGLDPTSVYQLTVYQPYEPSTGHWAPFGTVIVSRYATDAQDRVLLLPGGDVAWAPPLVLAHTDLRPLLLTTETEAT